MKGDTKIRSTADKILEMSENEILRAKLNNPDLKTQSTYWWHYNLPFSYVNTFDIHNDIIKYIATV